MHFLFYFTRWVISFSTIISQLLNLYMSTSGSPLQYVIVPFDNTTSIYLINLLCELGLRLALDLELHYFTIFHGE